jgi:Flp pilus assembly protein TadG
MGWRRGADRDRDEAMMRTSRARRVDVTDDRGATLVEFALLAPLFFLIIFGIIEFGWIFAQHLDVRHGTREGARLVAVDYADDAGDVDDQLDEIAAAICDRMDHASGATITFGLTADPVADPPSVDDFATIEVIAPADTITGFLDPMLEGIELQSAVETRLEQEAHWIESPWADQSRTCP